MVMSGQKEKMARSDGIQIVVSCYYDDSLNMCCTDIVHVILRLQLGRPQRCFT